MDNTTITIYSENTPGVLYRIANLFLRRKINIESLTVSEIKSEGRSRFTIVVKQPTSLVEKVAKQLERIIEVYKVEIHTDDQLIFRETVLIRVVNNAKYLKDKFKELGFDTGQSETPITPVMLGDEDLSLKFSARLLEEGVFASSIRFPLVPKGKARIRIIPSAIHTKEDLDFGISAFEKVGKAMKVI